MLTRSWGGRESEREMIGLGSVEERQDLITGLGFLLGFVMKVK